MQFGDNYMGYLPNASGSNYGMPFQRQENRGLHPVPSHTRNPLVSADQAMNNGEYFRLGGSGLNVSDPRFAAKYGNPYLRDPRNPELNGIRRGMTSAGNELGGVNVSPLHSPHRAPSAMGSGGRQYATLNTRNGRPYSPNSSLYRNNQSYGTIQQKSAKSGNREKGGAVNAGGSLLPNVLTENAKIVGNTTLHSATNAAAVANKYIGTMLGNGSIIRPHNDNVTTSISNKPMASQRGGKSSLNSHMTTTINNDTSGNGRIAETQLSAGNDGNIRQDVTMGSESHYILSPNSEAANQAALATHV